MNPAGTIITNGLGGTACAMINGAFRLGPCLLTVITPVEPHSPIFEGGSVPLAPGEIHGLYKPVENVNSIFF